MYSLSWYLLRVKLGGLLIDVDRRLVLRPFGPRGLGYLVRVLDGGVVGALPVLSPGDEEFVLGRFVLGGLFELSAFFLPFLFGLQKFCRAKSVAALNLRFWIVTLWGDIFLLFLHVQGFKVMVVLMQTDVVFFSFG